MAQHDYILANQSGAAFRSDLNNGLAAIVSNNSGVAQPSTTYAYQWWPDTTTGSLKLRNAANNAWITIGTLADANLGLATLASPTFTGTVTIPSGASISGFAPLASPTFTGTPTVPSLNGGPLAGTRNRIINGDMRIDQRGAVVTTDGAYTVDRWQLGFVTSGAVQSAQSGDAPTGFGNSLLFDVTTADTSIAAGEYGVLTQYIEGLTTSDLAWGTASAQTVTLSFWVKSTTTGTYCVSFRNSGNSRSYVATYSVASANTWEYKTITVSGDTSGTWLGTNAVGIAIAFCFAVGSTFQTTAGAWQASNFLATSAQTNLLASTANEIRITGVQLEPGTVATPFERRPIGTELALCQRYFQVLTSLRLTGNTTVGSELAWPITYTAMRANPTGTSTNFTLNNVASAAQPFPTNMTAASGGLRIISGGGGVTSAIDGVLTLEAEL